MPCSSGLRLGLRPPAYFLLSVVIEGRSMAKLFPAEYPHYKRATKMLIPYVL